MHHTIFVSDLHLCDTRPGITAAFGSFLSQTAAKADSLYILGDLFEYWPGDDCIAAGLYTDTIVSLRALSQAGVPVFFMHGNRDFLIGQEFTRTTGVTLLQDPGVITLYGTPVLLSHGDALCKDDLAYQEFRQQVRQPDWQTKFLSQPLPQRIAIIEQLRSTSDREKSAKSMDIMDVNQDSVQHLLSEYDYPSIFIHGHTHRPARHELEVSGHKCTRWVLGDWYEQGSYLCVSPTGVTTHKL